MRFSRRAFCGIGAAGWVAVGLLAGAVASRAGGFSMESVGVRGGFQADHSLRDFNQVGVFGNLNLPWDWDVGKEWHLQSRLDLSLGWLGGRSDRAFIGTLGPSLILSRARLPLSFDAGVSPTILSSIHFGSENFGMNLQFTSYLGLNWDFAPHWRFGYRFQHMSNGGLATPNPGLNMHMFALSYLF
jgi:outer membrane receptor protein involved in Fe transport